MNNLLSKLQDILYWCQDNRLVIHSIMLGSTGLITIKYFLTYILVKMRDAKMYEVISIASFVYLLQSLFTSYYGW